MTPTDGRPAPAADRARVLRRNLVVVAWCTLIFATAAYAEKADREKPINLEADRVTVDDARQIAVFEGHVVLTQGTLMIRGDRMQVRQDNDGFKHGTTWGNLAYFRQKREGYDDYIEGWAERIEYDGRADKMQMFNRALMKRGQDEVRGNYISYDATTEFFQVIGGGPKAATPNNPEGRVRAVLQPKPKEKTPAAPVSLTPAEKLGAPREEAGAPKK
ncbi:MAG: lipopolysaccharide transport periplasmic protein LptA [Betaproteobacteria bacterium RIFCSPLOWO2_12_FULL_62_13]|nr:MAG: lipopolysaccharide transport periplasmic protein LptA [Betaproteobacteria bacterium RIFCSPLOWO2_12_FULL_62_13]